MPFLNTLRDHCQEHPNQVALEWHSPPGAPDGGQRVSYGELDSQVVRTMAYLQSLCVRPGDRVALQLPKCLPFVSLHLAAMRLGAVSVPLNPAYPPHELASFLADAEACLLLASAAAESQLMPALAGLSALRRSVFLRTDGLTNFEAIRAAEAVPATGPSSPPHDPDATAMMFYTSGTTGRPKGAEITHGNLTANLGSLHRAWGWRREDVLLHVLPLFHVHGLVAALHGALHAGATAVLLPRFDPLETLEVLVEHPCSVFMGVPTMYRRLLDVPDAAEFDLGHMRLLVSGSDRLPDEVFLGFQHTFGQTLLERYGMTEAGMILSNPLHGERRMGSVGLPLPGVEARIVDPETGALLPDGDVGEVQIRGANVFKGYWRQPEQTQAAFTADGWFRTGDLGRREPDGYYTLKGRSKDLVITGGLNVYPSEVERILAQHPAVAASAVIGCPDPEWGERVTAVVVPKTDLAGAVTAAALMAHCRDYLAAYKVPKHVVFMDALPRNAMGKVEKAGLRATACES